MTFLFDALSFLLCCTCTFLLLALHQEPTELDPTLNLQSYLGEGIRLRFQLLSFAKLDRWKLHERLDLDSLNVSRLASFGLVLTRKATKANEARLSLFFGQKWLSFEELVRVRAVNVSRAQLVREFLERFGAGVELGLLLFRVEVHVGECA